MPGFNPRYKFWPPDIQRAWDIGDQFTLDKYFKAAAEKAARTKAQKKNLNAIHPLTEDEILIKKHMEHPDTKHVMSWHNEDILKEASKAIMTDLEKQQDHEKIEKLHDYLANPQKSWGKGGIVFGAPIGAAIGTAFINSSNDSVKLKAGKIGAGALIGGAALGTYGYIKGKILKNKMEENMQKTASSNIKRKIDENERKSISMSADINKPYEIGVYSKKNSENNSALAMNAGLGKTMVHAGAIGAAITGITGQPTLQTIHQIRNNKPLGIPKYWKSIGADKAVSTFTSLKHSGIPHALYAATKELKGKTIAKHSLKGALITGATFGVGKALWNKVQYEMGKRVTND